MRFPYILAVCALALLTTFLLAGPSAAGNTASCDQQGYYPYDYWRYEPDRGSCSYAPMDAFSGRDETLLAIMPNGAGDDFEIHATGGGASLNVTSSCVGSDCAGGYGSRPHAAATCEGICTMTFTYTLDDTPVTIEIDADVMQRSFTSTATFGEGVSTFSVDSTSSVFDSEQNIWDVFFYPAEPTHSPFHVPSLEIDGGSAAWVRWVDDNTLHARIQATPGDVTVTLPEGAMVTDSGNPNEAEIVSFQSISPQPVIDLGSLTQNAETNVVSASYSTPPGAMRGLASARTSGPAGVPNERLDLGGGSIAIPVLSPGTISLTLPEGYYRNGSGTPSKLAGPVSIEAFYAIALDRLDAPDHAHAGDEITLTAHAAATVNQGQVRFLLDGQPIGTSPISSGQASLQATMPRATAAFAAEVIETDGYRQTGPSAQAQVALRIKPLTLALDVPFELTYGEQTTIHLSVSDEDFAGEMIFSTADGTVSRTLPADARALSFTPERTGRMEFYLKAFGDPAFEDSVAPAVQRDVAKDDTALFLAASKDRVTPGDAFTLTANFGTTLSSGILTILADGQEIHRTAIDGRKSHDLEVVAGAAGEITYIARLTGSEEYQDTQSGPLMISTYRVPSQLDLTLESKTVHPGDDIVAKVAMTPAPKGGNITIFIGNEAVATKPAAAQIDFKMTAPGAGPHNLIARFSGDERHEAAQSSIQHLSISKEDTTISLSADNDTPVSGDAVELTAMIDPDTASGMVVFMNGDVEIGQATLSHGSASLAWIAGRGDARLWARYDGDANHEAIRSESLSITVSANTEEVFKQKAPRLQDAVQAETGRAAQARLRHHEWMMRDARTRLRNPGSRVGRSFVAPSYDGMLKADTDRIIANGAFHTGGDMGSHRRYVYGAFDMTREEGYGTTFEFNGAVALETEVGRDALAGLYLGAEIGKTDLDNGSDGEIETIGVNLGVYGAKRFNDDLVVDGFANLARLNHDIALRDEDLSASGDQGSTALQVGISATGERRYEGFTLAPQLSAVQSTSWVDDAQMRADGASGSSDVILEGGTSRSARISATPELILPVGRGGFADISIAPRAICQIEKAETLTRGCGAGLGLGYDRNFSAGRGHFSADIEVEDVSGRRREMLRIDVTVDF